MNRKRKLNNEDNVSPPSPNKFVKNNLEVTEANTNKQNIPQLIPFAGYKRQSTVSVAIPSSIISNAQTLALKSYLVGQIARSLAIFGVDEIIIFDDMSTNDFGPSNELKFFVSNLQYLETPQYLRKYLFKLEPDLKFAGIQNPIDTPNHLRKDEWLPYREGVVVEDPNNLNWKGSFVFCGLDKKVKIKKKLDIGTRCTIKFKKSKKKNFDENDKQFLYGKVVSSMEPLYKEGLYWGYKVKAVPNFPAIFKNCSFSDDGQFDWIVGTSQNGDEFDPHTHLPLFKNLLIVLGGVKGIESILECVYEEYTHPNKLFNCYINICPYQRSRTIRAEEALPIILTSFYPTLLQHQRSTHFSNSYI